MSDEPDQEEVRKASEEGWRSRPLTRREKSPQKEPNVPITTPEELAAEQREIQTFLQASRQAGVDPQVLAEHLSKVAEQLAKDEAEDRSPSE